MRYDRRRAAARTGVALLALGACASPRAVVTLEAPTALPAPLPPPVVLALPALWGVSPGMTADEVAAKLGAARRHRTHAEAEAWWTSAGYDPKVELPFVLGFDEQLSYNDDADADHESPAWDVYFAHGRAVLFKAALYDDRTKPELARFGFPPSCFIGEDAAAIALTFGKPDAVRDLGARRLHYYLQRGIAVMEESGHVQVLDIFTPLPGARAIRVAEALDAGR
ncbi:MAG TPA: hypothetical protein VGH28_13140 [Polyangiaceae bacterium]